MQFFTTILSLAAASVALASQVDLYVQKTWLISAWEIILTTVTT